MESTRNLIENNKLEFPNVSKFELVQEMLEAHIRLLIQHNVYLRKIEVGSIPEDEIQDYLIKVLGFSIPENGKFRTDYLPALKEALDAKLKIFLELSRMASHKNQDVAFSSLDLALEREIIFATYQASKMRSLTVTIKDKIPVALHGLEFLKSIKKQLQHILPTGHEKLTTIVKIKSKERKKVKGNRMGVSIDMSINYNWQRILDEQAELFDKISKANGLGGFKEQLKKVNINDKQQEKEAEAAKNEINALPSKKMVSRDGVEVSELEKREFVEAINEFAALPDSLNVIKKKNNIRPDPTLTELQYLINRYQLMQENIVYFYSIYPGLEKLNKVFNQVNADSEKENDLLEKFDGLRKDFISASRAQKGLINALKKSIESLSRKKKWHELESDLKNLIVRIEPFEKEVDAVVNLWPVKLPIEMSEAALLQLEEKLYAQLDRIKLAIKKIDADYLDLLNIEEEQTIEDVQQASPNIAQPKENERTLFLMEREKINQEYKAQVEQLRLEKNAAQRITASKETEQLDHITQFKNLDVEECLLNMSDKHFESLLDLFIHKKGIRYDDICNLITNQLHGSIEEIGNGSSHKRIRIAKYFLEIVNHEDEKPTPNVSFSSSVAVGGFFRPPGSGGMPRFNIELVVGTFKKAGITQEVLNQLQEKRLTQKKVVFR